MDVDRTTLATRAVLAFMNHEDPRGVTIYADMENTGYKLVIRNFPEKKKFFFKFLTASELV